MATRRSCGHLHAALRSGYSSARWKNVAVPWLRRFSPDMAVVACAKEISAFFAVVPDRARSRCCNGPRPCARQLLRLRHRFQHRVGNLFPPGISLRDVDARIRNRSAQARDGVASLRAGLQAAPIATSRTVPERVPRESFGPLEIVEID